MVTSANRVRSFNKLWNIDWPKKPWELKITDELIEKNLHIKDSNPISGSSKFRMIVDLGAYQLENAREKRDALIGVMDRFVIKSKVHKRRGWRMGCYKTGRLYCRETTGEYVYATEVTLPSRVYYNKTEKATEINIFDKKEWKSLVEEISNNVDVDRIRVPWVETNSGERTRTPEFDSDA